MLDNNKMKKVYDALVNCGYTQDYNTFFNGFTKADNYAKRKQIYDILTSEGAQIGDSYEDFMKRMQKQGGTSSASAAKKPYGVSFGQPQMPDLSKAASWKESPAREWTQRQLGTFDQDKDLEREVAKAAKKAQEPTKEQARAFVQQMRDEADYRQMTGKRLSDFGKDAPGSDFFTPTLKRNDDGTIVTGDNGEPLVGISTDESRKGASNYLGEKVAEREAQEKYEEENAPKPITGFGEAFKQGTKMMWEGLKNIGAETVNLVTGSNQEYLDAIDYLDAIKEYGDETTFVPTFNTFFKSNVLRQELENAGGSAYAARKNLRELFKSGNPKYSMENKALLEALKNNKGNISAARKELEEKARANESWGDRVKRDVSEAMEKQRPTEGFGAWVGNIAPQMVPSLVCMVAGGLTRNNKLVNQGLGMLNLGTMAASTAGLSMSEARKSGASDLQAWGVGLLDGGIEMWTEKIPLDRYTKRLLGFNSKAVKKAATEALTNPNSPAKQELQRLLQQARKKLGGKLFTRQNAKEFAGDILAEGLSEFTAEALETITPMIYQNPEEYPTLAEIFMNGLEGAKAGVFMGSVLGSASKGLQYAQNKQRIKKQGYIDVAQVQNSEDPLDASIVEVLGKDKDGGIVVRDGDEVRTVNNSDIQMSHRFTYDEFSKAKVEYDGDSDEALSDAIDDNTAAGYNAADEQSAVDFGAEYNAAREKAGGVFSDDMIELIDNDPVYALAQIRREGQYTDEQLAAAVDYVNAKAARDGALQRMEDDLDSAVEAARDEVSRRMNGDDFMIHRAQLKAENEDGTPKYVYVTGGNIALREDGSIDVGGSDQTIVVRDARTGKIEMISPSKIQSMDEAIDPQDEYAQAEANARAEYERKKAGVLEGRTEETEVPGNTEEPGENLQTETPQTEIKGKEEQAENQQIEGEWGNAPQIKPQTESENLQTETETETQTETEQAAAESPIVQQEDIPVEKDKKGNVVRTLYHKVPMQRTLEDLYDGSLDQEEIDGLVRNLAADAKKRLTSVENEEKPKIGNNKRAYLEAKKRYEEKLADARAEVEYYDNLQKEVLRVTQRGGQQTGVAEDMGGEPLSLEELAARFASEHKVTPESLKGETGMSGKELKGFVGLVAREENGGVSIERLGELLARSDEWAQLGGTPEMTQEARDMLIDAYMSGNPRSYIKQQRERFAQREAEHEMNEIENFAQAAFGMSAEEYLAYEEQALPAIINKYAGFDFDIYYAILQEQADARASEAEANYNNSINESTNEQQGESDGNGGSGGVLQTEGTADKQGERTSDEQEAGGQGSVGNAGLQGVGTQGNVGEDAPELVGEKYTGQVDPRTMSEEEKERRGNMLRNAPSISVEKGTITSTAELSARKAAEKWWDENISEPALYSTEVGEVEINRNSVESSLAHRYGQKKLDAITSLIEGFENAVYLGTLPDFSRQEGVNNHYFAYPIIYDGELNYVFCRAMQDANKNRLYVHEVFVGDKIKKGDTLQTAASQPHGGIALYRDILANVLEASAGKVTEKENSVQTDAEKTEVPGGTEVPVANEKTKKPAKKKTGRKYDIWKYTSKEQARVSRGIFHDPEGYAVASDENVLVADKTKYDESKKGKILSKDGTAIDGRYPNWKRLIGDFVKKGARRIKLDTEELLAFANGVRKNSRKGEEKSVSFRIGGHIILQDAYALERFAEAANALGLQQISLKIDDDGLYGYLLAEGENGCAAIVIGRHMDGEMPNFFGDVEYAEETDNPGSKAGKGQEESSKETQKLTHDDAISLITQMEDGAEVAPEIELTIENWDAQFGEDGRVETPIGEVKMGESQFAKLMRQGRDGKLGMIKPTLENPDVIIEEASNAKDGDVAERNSSYIFVKAFKKSDGSRYYYFTSITVSKGGREVVVSNQEKSRNRLLRLMTEGKVLWRTPKDATTASVEQQGLDYAQPSETETATKGSGVTPQSTGVYPSADKVTEKNNSVQTDAGKTDVPGKTDNPGKTEVPVENEKTKKPAKKKAGRKYDIWKFVGNGVGSTLGVFHDPTGYAVATDGYVLVADKAKYDEVKKGKVEYKNGATEETGYPNWRRLLEFIAKQMPRKVKLNAEKLSEFSYGLRKNSQPYEEIYVSFSVGGVTMRSEAHYMERFAIAANAIGSQMKCCIEDDGLSGYLIAEGDNGTAIIRIQRAEGVGTEHFFGDAEYAEETDNPGSKAGKTKKQKTDIIKPVSKKEAALRDALSELMRGAGIEVIEDVEWGQRVIDAENGKELTRGLRLAIADKEKGTGENPTAISENTDPSTWGSSNSNSDAKVDNRIEISNSSVSDLKITDKVRFFRTADGRAYGFTVGGKIFIDPRIAGADTPIHEYTHIWAEALRKANPKEWENIVRLMKGTGLWEEVKRKYPELTTDSEIADEVLAHYSGKRGAERLRKAQDEALKNGNGILEKAAAVAAINKVREALNRFWKGVADFFGVHFNSAEEVADKVLSDLLNGVNPEVPGKTEVPGANEEAEIIAKAKADGTYMKAPNGEKSNLTPKQWVQVRTKAFKKWFGDWELGHKVLNIVSASKEHGFKNFEEAKAWAKENIVRTLSNEETGGKGEVRISGNAVSKFLSESAVAKSESKDVHLSVLKELPAVIRESVDAEQHPDYKKGEDGKRGEESGVNEHVTIHRLYAAVDIDGKTYRVKVTLKEFSDKNEPNSAYSYEATKIELLAGTLVDGKTTDPSTNNSISAAKLLENVEKSYGKGEKLLDCSKVVDENGEPKVVLHGTPNTFTAFDKSKIGSSNDPGWLGSGFYFYGNNEDYAMSYSRGGNLMEVFLNIRDPYYASYSEMERLAEENSREVSEEFRAMVEEEGNDGVYYNEDLNEEWVAFEPTQIKSATDNVGTFDGTNGDIRYREADRTEVPGKAEEMKRDGRGAYTSDEVSIENDPWSKMAGYNIRSKRERREFAERERRRMVDTITDMAKRFGIADAVEIVTDLSGLKGRQRRAKGIYRKSTGKITIYIPNHVNVADAVATFLHEAVAHKGLRNLFGEHFDEFLDKVYENVDKEIRAAIDALAKKKGYSTRTATEEYLAGLAENTDFEHLPYDGWWQRVKEFFIDMLHKVGIKSLDTTTLTDNELRYILWRSYRYMTGKDKGIIAFVEDTAMKTKLGVGYSEKEGVSGAAEVNEAEVPGETDIPGGTDIPGSIEEVNKRFNEELKQHERQELPAGHRFELGYPSKYLLSAGFDNLPISMRASLLSRKAGDEFHPFNASSLKDLVKYLQKPIAIFKYSKDNMRNVIVEAQSNGKHFLVGITLNFNANGLEINSVSGLFPKESHEWIKWIQDGKAVRIDDKKKVQDLINSLRTNPAESERIGLNLNATAKIVENFENPKIEGENSEEELFRDGETDVPGETEVPGDTDGGGKKKSDTKALRDILMYGNLSLAERTTAAKLLYSNIQNWDKKRKADAVKAIGENIADLAKAMRLQRDFDKATVKRVHDLARVLMESGYLSGMTEQEVKRLLAAVKNSVGKNDIDSSVQKVMDIMIDNMLRRGKAALAAIESVRGSKTDARGVEVQGMLGTDGQTIVKAFREAKKIVSPCAGKTEEDGGETTAWGAAFESVYSRMDSKDQAVADEAALEYAGMQMAQQWYEEIAKSKLEEEEIKLELKEEHDKKSAEERRTDSYREFEASMEEAIRQNKIERAQAYFNLAGRLSDSLRGSVENALAFKEAEKQRIGEIHHAANSDMQGRSAKEHQMPSGTRKALNNLLGNYLFTPLATYMEMLRLFGSKSVNGEGYLFNRFGRGWIDARQKEIRGVREKFAVLDAKAKEVFGGKVKTWGDLIRAVGKMPKGKVSFFNGGEMQEMELGQGNLMYIYMVNKMLDGKMKLRKMGISEEDVSQIEAAIDPRLKEIADWLQEKFLVNTRNEYNETHKRMFGASMAAVENYFPLRILNNALDVKADELDHPKVTDGISTITGSIIKRRRNSKPLDILNADALHVVLSHVGQMEHWNAYAEFNRDLNTLRSYRHFRNQVQNMETIYGNGKNLWNKFNDVCQMASGVYMPKGDESEKAALAVAQGVTAAAVSFRLYTALKQFASFPAYIPYTRADYLTKAVMRPDKSWEWCMKNLPIFEERWKSRVSGDPRLVKSFLTAADWRRNLAANCARAGMAPNAFIDALTCSMGAYAVYNTRKNQYLKDGYSEEQAERKAIQDAEMVYNETQQSGEDAFTSTMQRDRTWWKSLFTIFRNASMSYQRQLHGALRDLGNVMSGGVDERVAFVTKQLLREKGIKPKENGEWSEEDYKREEEIAKRKVRRQFVKDGLSVGTFGYIMQLAWNIAGYLPYLLFGDDDETKDEFWDDIRTHTFGGWLEGFTGGDVMSLAIGMLLNGKYDSWKLKKEMPVTTATYDAIGHLLKGDFGAFVSNSANLLMQMSTGVNPQSLTDGALAIMDACGDEPALANEAVICISRILSVPQSQIDNLYFDEVGLRGDEVSKYTPAQIAERYALYKVKRGRFFAPWSWDDEELIGKQEDKANTAIKERLGHAEFTEVSKAYERYEKIAEEIGGQVNALNKAGEEGAISQEEYDKRMDVIEKDKNYNTYALFKYLDKPIADMAKQFMQSKSPEEAAFFKDAIERYRLVMLDALSASNYEERIKYIKRAEYMYFGTQDEYDSKYGDK